MEFLIKCTSKWEDSETHYSNSKILKLGSMPVASIFYDGARSSRDQIEPYKLITMMHGIKQSLGYFLTEELAKEKAEKVLSHWVTKFLSNQE